MFTFNHFNFNVLDLDRSLEFYDKALGLKPVRENHGDNFTLVYLGDGKTDFQLELTYLHDRKEPYELGELEYHLAMTTDDIEASVKLHEELDCIVFVNEGMGIYFIEDPDGYWIEIIPAKWWFKMMLTSEIATLAVFHSPDNTVSIINNTKIFAISLRI